MEAIRLPCPWPSYAYDHGEHVWHTNRKGEPISERAVTRYSIAYCCRGRRGEAYSPPAG